MAKILREIAAIDERDRRLIAALQENARATYAELGERAGLSQSSVFERLRKLESRGVIRGYRAEVDPEALGLSVTAFINVTTSGSCALLAEEVEPIPEIEEFHSTAGESCAMLKVRTSSPSHLQDLLDRLRSMPMVERTQTTVVLQTRFERGTQAAP